MSLAYACSVEEFVHLARKYFLTSGYLMHWLTQAGTYYYSSSYSSPASPPFRGSIVVTDRDDYLLDVNVTAAGVEAEYDTSSAST